MVEHSKSKSTQPRFTNRCVTLYNICLYYSKSDLDTLDALVSPPSDDAEVDLGGGGAAELFGERVQDSLPDPRVLVIDIGRGSRVLKNNRSSFRKRKQIFSSASLLTSLDLITVLPGWTPFGIGKRVILTSHV